MISNYIADKSFEKTDFRLVGLPSGEYEACRFIGCDFSECDFSNFLFTDCEFLDSNLSLVKLIFTGFRDVRFTGCKMIGLHFDQCNDFGLSFSFDKCVLDQSVFFRKKLKKSIFKNCQLKESDFSECDLSGSVFENCNLSGSIFDNTNLEMADFMSAYNFSIDPEQNKIKKARFSRQNIEGLLNKYNLLIDNKYSSK
ncbi:Pentapeptide Repeat-Containing Protein [Bacteroidales bacterium CF]|jgi:Uncharacterized low-complexity proteins|nr:Pentapeptide Repeat-Containing Protein [Bacteroidales bacterium CF]